MTSVRPALVVLDKRMKNVQWLRLVSVVSPRVRDKQHYCMFDCGDSMCSVDAFPAILAEGKQFYTMDGEQFIHWDHLKGGWMALFTVVLGRIYPNR